MNGKEKKGERKSTMVRLCGHLKPDTYPELSGVRGELSLQPCILPSVGFHSSGATIWTPTERLPPHGGPRADTSPAHDIRHTLRGDVANLGRLQMCRFKIPNMRWGRWVLLPAVPLKSTCDSHAAPEGVTGLLGWTQEHDSDRRNTGRGPSHSNVFLTLPSAPHAPPPLGAESGEVGSVITGREAADRRPVGSGPESGWSAILDRVDLGYPPKKSPKLQELYFEITH
ncbi:hypothetical protein EYF80_043975 [Liparis tanakae]|uniref:Uncharacterized protein n=1 Tax=Liparis tanakae TaxID=230148 RepID=A0A4Z2FY55_9TELE|nr:hypothetical protein EYF80_043975 [Liparis tanakae]